METKEELLTVDEVAQLLKMHPGSVRRLIQQDKIPVERLGHRTVRIRRTNVAALLLDNDANANDGTAGTGESAELLRRAAYVLRLAREVVANDPDDPWKYTDGYEELADQLEAVAMRWKRRNIPGEVQLRMERTQERLRQIHQSARTIPLSEEDE